MCPVPLLLQNSTMLCAPPLVDPSSCVPIPLWPVGAWLVWRDLLPIRNDLERTYLEMLDFNIDVDSSVYAKYYFELRILAERTNKIFSLTMLDKEGAKKLEVGRPAIPSTYPHAQQAPRLLTNALITSPKWLGRLLHCKLSDARLSRRPLIWRLPVPPARPALIVLHPIRRTPSVAPHPIHRPPCLPPYL